MIDQYLLRQNTRVIERFHALDEDERREVERQFDRHEAACKRVGVDVCHLWLDETISEIYAGRFFTASA